MNRLKELFKFRSIQKKMMVAIILFLVLPLIIISYSYTRTTELLIQDQIEEENGRMLEQVNRSLEAEMKHMINAANFFALSKSVKSVLFDGDIDYDADYKSAEKKYYKNYMIINESMGIVQNTILSDKQFHITLFDLQGNNYTSQPKRTMDKDDSWRQAQWFEETINLNGYMLWTFHYDEESGDYLVTLSRLVNESVESRWNGVITITCKADELFGSILEQYESEEVFITDQKGRIISHSQNVGIGDSIQEADYFNDLTELKDASFVRGKDSEKQFYSHLSMEVADWKLISISDYATLFHQLITVRTSNLVMIGLVLLLFIFISYIIIQRVTKPLNNLMSSMKDVEKGDLSSYISVSGEDEIANLGHQFNNMVQEINQLIINIQEEQKKEEALKLQILYAQINPHFLFNTLNTIKWIAVINESNNVAKLIGDLGRLLEMSIKDIDRPITIEEELNNLKSYLNLQQARYNKRHSIIYDVDEKIKKYIVPKLILQPIVENSLIHGLDSDRPGNLTITVGGKMNLDQEICFTISDDGKGISEEILSKILDDSELNISKDRFSGIGLINVDQRIGIKYGDKYGLKVTSKLGKGTQVRILLPRKEIDYD